MVAAFWPGACSVLPRLARDSIGYRDSLGKTTLSRARDELRGLALVLSALTPPRSGPAPRRSQSLRAGRERNSYSIVQQMNMKCAVIRVLTGMGSPVLQT
jgi:hypothetical protein